MMETLTLQQSTIRGVVLGKAVFCTLRGSPAGLRLAAGNYLLRPAQNNPVYGVVMAIEPLTRAAEAATGAFDSFGKARPAAFATDDSLKAPAADYLKAPAVPPGKVAFEPPAAAPPANPSAVKFTEPAAHKVGDPAAVKFADPAAHKVGDPAAIKFADPAAHKIGDPAAVKFRDPAAIKFTDPSAVKMSDPSAVKFADPAAHKTGDPAAVKYADPVAIKYADPSTLKFGPAAAVATLVPPHAPAVKFDTAAGQVNQPVMITERSIAGNSFQATAGFGDLVEVVQRAGAVRLVVV